MDAAVRDVIEAGVDDEALVVETARDEVAEAVRDVALETVCEVVVDTGCDEVAEAERDWIAELDGDELAGWLPAACPEDRGTFAGSICWSDVSVVSSSASSPSFSLSLSTLMAFQRGSAMSMRIEAAASTSLPERVFGVILLTRKVTSARRHRLCACVACVMVVVREAVNKQDRAR